MLLKSTKTLRWHYSRRYGSCETPIKPMQRSETLPTGGWRLLKVMPPSHIERSRPTVSSPNAPSDGGKESGILDRIFALTPSIELQSAICVRRHPPRCESATEQQRPIATATIGSSRRDCGCDWANSTKLSLGILQLRRCRDVD